MQTKGLRFLVFAALITAFVSCGEDTPPEKTVGSITIVVTEENTPETLTGVSIQLFSDEDPSVTPADRTDNSGRCTFSNIPLGSYHMNLSKPGYESREGLNLRINGGDNPNKELTLKRITTVLTVAPTSLDFGDNASVVQKAFSMVNPNYWDLEWSVQNTSVAWIVSVCDKEGKSYGTIKYNQEVAMSVTIDRSKLPVGNNESTIVILSDYGRAELKVKATGTPDPSVHMASVSSIGFENAYLTGKVLEVGVPPYKECGFVVSDKPEPTLSGALKKITIPSSSSSEFNSKVDGLSPKTQYYVRAFILNDNVTVYSSNELNFTTKTPENPVISTLTPTNVYENGATIRGYVQSIGNPAFTKKGFVISSTTNTPTVDDNEGGWTITGSQTGEYALSIKGLTENRTYYIRTFAITPYATVYYNVVSFIPKKPYVVIGSLAVHVEDEYDYEYGESSMSHASANRVCNNLVLGSYDDWRLPTAAELKIIYAHRNEIGGFSSAKYWTSTKNKDEGNYEGGAWDEGYVAIDFATGEVKYNNPYVSYSYKVRAVRSLQ